LALAHLARNRHCGLGSCLLYLPPRCPVPYFPVTLTSNLNSNCIRSFSVALLFRDFLFCRVFAGSLSEQNSPSIPTYRISGELLTALLRPPSKDRHDEGTDISNCLDGCRGDCANTKHTKPKFPQVVRSRPLASIGSSSSSSSSSGKC
jgi:hypothetical protein